MTTDWLTERLHSEAETLPASPRSAGQLRRSAERAQTARRRVGATLVSAAVVAVVVGWTLRPHILAAPVQPPATTTSVEPSPGIYVLKDSPLPTNDDWHRLNGGATVQRQGSETVPITGCGGDTLVLGTTQTRDASYLDLGQVGARINEYVLRFDTVVQAIDGFANLRDRLTACKEVALTVDTLSSQHPIQPTQELLVAEGSLAGNLAVPDGYQFILGRNGNVLIFIESPRRATTLFHRRVNRTQPDRLTSRGASAG